jgi:hypothetical protein
VGTTNLAFVVLATAVSTLPASLLLGFTATGFGFAVILGSLFLDLAAFLVAVTLVCVT